MVRWEVKTRPAVEHRNSKKIRELLKGAKSPLVPAYSIGYDHGRFRLHQPVPDLPESLLRRLKRKRGGVTGQNPHGHLLAHHLLLDTHVMASNTNARLLSGSEL